ncbi:unnamed protein product [Notodromas monacha]|uniref:Cuticle protein n=1 Tax=Notodromas monacha TaxID=399045 RepID=A0A7R9GG91_9CRUS|nr:unnamed protein product [Notodromas monacha]CAG0921587.1 unnamed protein product [Notodromas monacha]
MLEGKMRLFLCMLAVSAVGATSTEKRHSGEDNDIYIDDHASLVRSGPANSEEYADGPSQYAIAYEPPRYNYNWAVNDDYSSNYQQVEEARDGERTHGSYRVLQPDGVYRTVVYNVDGDQGFNADVRYQRDSHHNRAKAYRQEYEEQSGSEEAHEGEGRNGPSARSVSFFPSFVPAEDPNIEYFTIDDAVAKPETSVPSSKDADEPVLGQEETTEEDDVREKDSDKDDVEVRPVTPAKSEKNDKNEKTESVNSISENDEQIEVKTVDSIQETEWKPASGTTDLVFIPSQPVGDSESVQPPIVKLGRESPEISTNCPKFTAKGDVG